MLTDLKRTIHWNNNMFKFAIFLVILLLLSFVDLIWTATSLQEKMTYILNLILIFSVTTASYVFIYSWLNIKNINVLHLLTTTIIMYLVIHPTTPWFMYIVVLALAVLGKHYLRYRMMPIFNPAALGIALAYIVSIFFTKLGILPDTLFESWWGSDLQYSFLSSSPLQWIVIAVLVSLFLYFAKRFNRLPHALVYFFTYIGFYIMYSLVKGSSLDWISYLVNLCTGPFVFLAFVMVTEPKTSPVMKNQQIWLGVIGGAILFVISNIIPDYIPKMSIGIPTIGALLLLNYATFLIKQMTFQEKVV